MSAAEHSAIWDISHSIPGMERFLIYASKGGQWKDEGARMGAIGDPGRASVVAVIGVLARLTGGSVARDSAR